MILFLFLRDLAVCIKTKHLIFFIFVLTKTRYFNIKFVSLQYKNTNQYCAKLIKKIYGKITNFFKIF